MTQRRRRLSEERGSGRNLTVRLPQEMYDEIEQLALTLGWPKGQVVEEAFKAWHSAIKAQTRSR